MGINCIKTLQNSCLVLGIGNLLLNDEGVGIHVVSYLEKEGFKEANLLDGGTGGFHLLGVLGLYDYVIIVDASLDKYPPGTVRILKPGYAKDFPIQLSAHEIGLKDLLDAVYLLGDQPDIYLISISVKEFQDLGMELTPEVEKAIPEAAELVKELVHSLVNGIPSTHTMAMHRRVQ